MSKVKVLMSVLSAGVVTAAVVASPALAWHPEGVIKKYVQNQTTNSVKSDANDASTAVAAKPGDILKYTIEVSNKGKADSKGWNDMAKTVMTDTLPAGVELVSDPAARKITADLGLITPGKSVAKEYLVKVTASKDGSITNEACFTGNSTANDNPQKGCDKAVIKVQVPIVPVTPEKPVEPKTPEVPTTPTPETPVELPNTGSTAVFGALAGVGSMSLAGYHYLRSKRNLRSAHNR